MTKLLAALAPGGGLMIGAPVAQSAPITYFAFLSGPVESPPNASPSVGRSTVIIDTTAVRFSSARRSSIC